MNRLPLRVLCCQVLLASLFASLGRSDDSPPDFSQAGVAFLKKHCVECHSGEKPKAELSLAGFVDNASVVKKRKVWESVLKMVEAGEMPPDGKPQPKTKEVEQFAALARAVFDHHDKNAKPDPGRVTMRRLNRVEYANTVRDLVGIDFNPTEDFPSDDIGHGFDNIGDVLTLSPVLMERYLAAAETIMDRAILPKPPPSPKRHLDAQYTEPSGDVPKTRFRAISTKSSDKPTETGPIFTDYILPTGEYVFRTRVYAETSDDKPVRLAVLACSRQLTDGAASDEEADKLFGLAVKDLRPFRIVEIVDVTARESEEAQSIKVAISPMKGLDRLAVAVLKPIEGQGEITLHVEFLALDGPADMRPESHRALLACSADKPKPDQTREVLTRFARRAYRRPPTDVEVDRLIALSNKIEADGGRWEEALQFAMQAVLVNPKFLFRAELDDSPTAPDARPLSEFQLASRLSYFLWNSMPDDELFELAGRGELSKNLEPQVLRMLKDSRASAALVDQFALQWLQLKRLELIAPDAKLFPDFNDGLRRAMLKETRMFFEAIMQEDRSLLDLLVADFTFLNEPLARHYGIADTNGNLVGQKPGRNKGQPFHGREFVRVNLEGTGRGGLLTQASVLTVTSNPTRTSPVKRGRWVLEQLLGTPPPPPPPNVPELEQGEKLTGSLRQRMEQHRANPSCANCHARMDPLGFAFENFDAIGRFREKDGEFPIDPAGELPTGETFSGPNELKEILKSRQNLFARCITEKLLTYAIGRGLEYYDRPAVDRIATALGQNGYRFSTLIVETVKSEPFRLRRGKSADE